LATSSRQIRKHGRNSYDNYLAVHRSTLKKFSGYSTGHPSYDVRIRQDALSLRTSFEVETQSGKLIGISVVKVGRITWHRGRKYCETVDYSYVAYDSATGRQYFSYHSPHLNLVAKSKPHHRYHHKHLYLAGKVIFPLHDDEIPHVSDFLEEVIETL